MDERDSEKILAARRAAALVSDGMIVGLGSGSTSAHLVRELGRLVGEGLRIEAIPTSQATEDLARSVGISITSFERHAEIDLTIDGADEIDPRLHAIKGGGGALLREKIVAAAAKRMVVIADSSKWVEKLGRFKLPLEVLPFGAGFVMAQVEKLGARVALRRRGDGAVTETDQGNYIIDASFGAIEDAPGLAAQLDAIPGILEHGLFLDEVDVLLLARGAEVEVVRRGV